MNPVQRLCTLSALTLGFAVSPPLAGQDPDPVIGGGDEIATLPIPEATRAHDDFALRLFRQLATRQDGNLLLAPTTARGALAMASYGARGETRAEMARVLNMTAEDARDQLQILQEHFAVATGARLNRASRVFGHRDLVFHQPFLAACRADHQAAVEYLDFAASAERARLHINGWVGEQTSGRIPELLQRGILDADTRVVLCDALDFAADWAQAFDPERTQEQPFTVRPATTDAPARTVAVPMMYGRSGSLRCAAVDGAQIVELPYAGGQLSMLLIIPDQVDGLATIERDLDVAQLGRWRAALARDQVMVALPRFEMRTALRLDDALQELGMRRAFRGGADFSGMAEGTALVMGPVVHGAMIKVDETGTEAAGATAVVMKRGGNRARMVRADRPFLFVIQHHGAGGAALFVGRVSDPTAD